VPEALKLFAVRNKDLKELVRLLPTFLKAMQGCLLAVQYYYMRYEVNDWKDRFLYWGSSALHALYSHKEQKIVPRVKAFLGENTLIYEPTEHADFEFLPPNPLTIKDVLDDVNEVRNCIAHGGRKPDRYFAPGGGRQTLNGVVNFLAVLDDSLSFIIRVLLKILRDDLVENFKSRHEYSLFWKKMRRVPHPCELGCARVGKLTFIFVALLASILPNRCSSSDIFRALNRPAIRLQ